MAPLIQLAPPLVIVVPETCDIETLANDIDIKIKEAIDREMLFQ